MFFSKLATRLVALLLFLIGTFSLFAQTAVSGYILNEDGLPKLRISNFYKNMLAKEAASKKESKEKGEKHESSNEAQDYVQDKLRSAVWLIKSIHQRQRTIYKVAESIVKHQQ